MAGSEEDRAFRFDLGATPPPAGAARTRDLGHLDLDLGDWGTPAQALSTPPPSLSTAPGERAPTRTAPARLGEAPWGGLTPSAPGIPADELPALDGYSFAFDAEPSPPAPSAPATAEPSSPAVKPIRFPGTRFASSVSGTRPRLDSEDDLEAPEDLPEPLQRIADKASPPTVSLVALARDLRERWQLRQRQALHWGTEGARAGRHLASEFQRSLRRPRLVATAGASTTAASQAPSAAATAAPAAPAPGRPRWHGWAKRASLPAGTLALALAVHWGGSELLGHVSLPALSKSQVPDLGRLPTRERDPRPPERRGKGAAKGQRPSDDESVAPKDRALAPGQEAHVEFVPLPAGLDYPGKGVIEVVTSEDELIYVDRVFIGRGPLRRVPVTPGDHELSIRNGSAERHATAQVQAGRCSRALFVRAAPAGDAEPAAPAEPARLP